MMIEQYFDNRPIVPITLPAKHMEIRMVRAPETYLFGSRGSLKTTRGIALYAIDMIYEMPRSTGVGVALSYEHLDTNTIEPLLKGFADFGFYAEKHYVINKKPPEHWPKPYDYNGNDSYKRTITWCNGTTIKFVSLARKAAANAISAQWGFFDETKFMNPEVLKEIFPIFRGNDQYFKHLSSYLSKFFATDKLADPAEIEWLLSKRNLVDHDRVEDIKALQFHLNDLQTEYVKANKTARIKLEAQIKKVQAILNQERSEMVYVSEINCYDVLDILGIKWLKSAKRNAQTKRIWEVAYENKDPDKPGEAFYPAFSEEIHTYQCSGQDDIVYDAPFIIAADYQHTVIPVPVAQISTLPGRNEPSLNYVDYIYTLYPKGLKDAIAMFCKKYEHHGRKKVYYVYDHTAVGKRTDADEYAVIVVKELKAHHWTVEEVYTGQAPGHYQKYADTNDWLEHKIKDPTDADLTEGLQKGLEMEIRLHRTRCANLITSITTAPARTKNGKTEKDKKYEDNDTYPDLDQSKTTHASDAFDMINDAVIKQKLIKPNRATASFALR